MYFQELLPVGGRIFYDTHFHPLLQMQGFAKELAFDVVCADKSRMPVLLSSTLKRDAAGRPLLIRTMLLDARARRSYEQELLRARRKAEEAESRVRTLNQELESLLATRTAERDRLWRLSQDLLVVAAADGRILQANPAFSVVLGWGADEARALNFNDLVEGGEGAAAAAAAAGVLALLAASQSVHGQPLHMRRKDGSGRWLSWKVASEDGMLYMTGRDITAERQRNDELRLAEDALRQAAKMEAVGQLTGGIAHDFNNLLAGMTGNLQLIRLKLERGLTADLLRHVDVAESLAHRAATTTHRLLTFSRQQALAPKAVDINSRIQFVHELIQTAIGRGLEVQLELDPANPHALCDSNQLESALLNLAVNARDAMDGTGLLTISSGTVQLLPIQAAAYGIAAGSYVHLVVADTGSGMSPELIARAFDPFFTTKPAGAGTGLGLSMVYGFARQSGGYVRIESEGKGGTRVHLYLPVTGASAADPVHATPVALASRGRGRILLVDDEAALRELLAEMLASQGYDVFQAANGPAALARFNELGCVDVLVTDIGLPGGLSGKQLAQHLKPACPDLKVLFITGYANPTVQEGLLQDGMELLLKPFDLEEFSARIGRLMAAGRH
ncbi:MAG: hybrid sensor histidine kinase/response regulator [Paucimonas sp.]|nr:hybrid sensor histidine kinase/response regulator [Paucimonas sp.]